MGKKKDSTRPRFSKSLAGVIVMVVAVLAAVFLLYGGRSEGTLPQPIVPVEENKTALIYDSLYREYPNETLIDELVSLLESNGYHVYVFQGINATLDPLVSLNKFDFIVIRAHGAYNDDPERPLGSYIYTGLRYEEAKALYDGYIDENLVNGLLALAVIPPPGVELNETILETLPKYVAVSPEYLEQHLGKFKNDTIVIAAGCYTSNDSILADVFLDKGAKAFIGWRGEITQNYMDQVTLEVVKLLLERHEPSDIPILLGDLVQDPLVNGTLVVKTR